MREASGPVSPVSGKEAPAQVVRRRSETREPGTPQRGASPPRLRPRAETPSTGPGRPGLCPDPPPPALRARGRTASPRPGPESVRGDPRATPRLGPAPFPPLCPGSRSPWNGLCLPPVTSPVRTLLETSSPPRDWVPDGSCPGNGGGGARALSSAPEDLCLKTPTEILRVQSPRCP